MFSFVLLLGVFVPALLEREQHADEGERVDGVDTTMIQNSTLLDESSQPQEEIVKDSRDEAITQLEETTTTIDSDQIEVNPTSTSLDESSSEARPDSAQETIKNPTSTSSDESSSKAEPAQETKKNPTSTSLDESSSKTEPAQETRKNPTSTSLDESSSKAEPAEDTRKNPTSTSQDESSSKAEPAQENIKNPTSNSVDESSSKAERAQKTIREKSTMAKNKEEATRKGKQDFLLVLAPSEMAMTISAALAIDFLQLDPRQNLELAVFYLLDILTFFSSSCLLLHTFFMVFSSNALNTQIHRTTSKVLLVISIIFLILTSISPITFLPKPYYILPSIIIPVLLTLGFYFYIITQTNDENESDEMSVDFSEQFKAITSLSEIMQGLISLSLSGLIGILFGSWTNALNRAHHLFVKISICCLFFSFISSLSLTLLCQMRVDSLSTKTRVILIRTIRASGAFLFSILALAALVVSSYFLKEYIVATLLPILLAGVVGFSIEFCTTGDQGDYSEDKLKLIFTTAKQVTTLSFAVIMGIFGAYLGSQETNMHLNICMIFMAPGFISGLSLMMLSYEAPKKMACMEVVFGILGCCGICYFVFGGISIFVPVFLRL